MLCKHALRLAAPSISHHAAGVVARPARSLCTSRSVLHVAPAPTAHVHAAVHAVQTTGSTVAAAGSASRTGSTASANRLLVAGAVASLLAYGLSQLEGHEEHALLRHQLAQKLAELRRLLGLSLEEAQCEAAAPVPAPARLNFDAAAAVTSAHPVIGVDHQLASWWRRFFAYLIDNGLNTVLDVCATLLLNRVFFGDPLERALELAFAHAYSPTEMLMAAVVAIVWEVTWGVMCNGQTPGKWAMGIRTVKQDGSRMDAATALKSGVTRALLMPPAAADVILPRLPFNPVYRISKNDLTRDKQAFHNWVADTIVIDERDQTEEDE